MGILCSIKELNVTNGKVSFAEDCIEVPVYEFNSDNILRLENGLSFIEMRLPVFRINFIS